MGELVLCHECKRHVLTTEQRCPFCAAALCSSLSCSPAAAKRSRGSVAAAVLGAGVLGSASLINGCQREDVPMYGAPPYYDSAGGNSSTEQGGTPNMGNGGSSEREQGGEAGVANATGGVGGQEQGGESGASQ